MFGYEGLEKGSEFYFSVEIDDEALAPVIEEADRKKTCGQIQNCTVSAFIEITKTTFGEIPSAPSLFSINGNSYITVYADGRLIFLDETGTPTFQPTAQMLGLKWRNRLGEVTDQNLPICSLEWQCQTRDVGPCRYRKRQCLRGQSP